MNETEFISILTKYLKEEEKVANTMKQLISDLRDFEGKMITARIRNKSSLIKRYFVEYRWLSVDVGLTSPIHLGTTDNKIYNEESIKERNPAYFKGTDERIANMKRILSDKKMLDKEYQKYKRIESAVKELQQLKLITSAFDNPAHYKILKRIGASIFGDGKDAIGYKELADEIFKYI